VQGRERDATGFETDRSRRCGAQRAGWNRLRRAYTSGQAAEALIRPHAGTARGRRSRDRPSPRQGVDRLGRWPIGSC